MIKFLDKYDVLKICDECGREKVVSRSCGNNLVKKEKHFCQSCANKRRIMEHRTVSCLDKSIYTPSKLKSRKFVKMVTKY